VNREHFWSAALGALLMLVAALIMGALGLVSQPDTFSQRFKGDKLPVTYCCRGQSHSQPSHCWPHSECAWS
jgi:hypothetical protein